MNLLHWVIIWKTDSPPPFFNKIKTHTNLTSDADQKMQHPWKIHANISIVKRSGQYISTLKALCNYTLIPSARKAGLWRKDWSPLMMKPWHHGFIFHNTVQLRTPLLLWKFPQQRSSITLPVHQFIITCLAPAHQQVWVMKRSNIILTVLHAHSQSHIITASILIFTDTRPRPVQIRQTNEGELMKYQHSHSSLHSNLHANGLSGKFHSQQPASEKQP